MSNIDEFIKDGLIDIMGMSEKMTHNYVKA